jgi:hypothetical protein
VFGRIGHVAVASLESNLGALGTTAVDWITSIGPASGNTAPLIALAIVVFGFVIWAINELVAGGEVASQTELGSALYQGIDYQTAAPREVSRGVAGFVKALKRLQISAEEYWKRLSMACSCSAVSMSY